VLLVKYYQSDQIKEYKIGRTFKIHGKRREYNNKILIGKPEGKRSLGISRHR
jgi:hypothetical protein